MFGSENAVLVEDGARVLSAEQRGGSSVCQVDYMTENLTFGPRPVIRTSVNEVLCLG